MNRVAVMARVLLGLVFGLSGANGFLHFAALPRHGGPGGQFMEILEASGYLLPVYALQMLGGGLLLANRFVPLALVLLAPVLCNILLFHLLLAPSGLGVSLVPAALWAVVGYRERTAFAGLVAARPSA